LHKNKRNDCCMRHFKQAQWHLERVEIWSNGKREEVVSNG